MRRVFRNGFFAFALAVTAGGCATKDNATPSAAGDRPNGASCDTAGDCVSGVCNVGVCQARVNGMGRANGGSCRDHGECASGFCISGTCSPTPGATGTNRPIGAVCTAPEQCTSSRCEDGACRAASTIDAGGDDATAGGDARSDRPDGGRPNGSACGAPTECASGACVTSVCVTPGTTGAGNGAACTAPAQCASGFCVAGVCQSNATGGGGANGAACTAPAQCASGFCVAGVCQSNATGGGGANGAACTTGAQCASGFCIAGACAAIPTGGRPTGALCSAPSDCASGVCTDGTCRDGGSATSPDPTMPPTIETRVNGEICDDGLDNDGDGQVNEDCPCNPGDRMQCYPGRPDHAGGTRCQWGSMACNTTGRWNACTGFGRPQMEECNGIDDNCDGQIDEECGCPTAGMTRSCYGGPMGSPGVGVCRSGTQRCEADMAGRLVWGECEGMIVPNFESCNSVDDDCDGDVDEGCECALGATRDCTAGAGTPGTGICRGGRQRCLPRADGGSTWGACVGAVGPRAETCNGADDNCDGRTDEGCSCTAGQVQPCYNGPAGTAGRGVCRAGTTTCQPDGTWGACSGATLPGNREQCNMVDDDCDGEVDEGCLCPAGQSPVFRRRAVTPPPVCGMHMGDGGASLNRTCEPGSICPEGSVGVQVGSSIRCVDPPPACEIGRYPNYYRASGWVCDRGCEVLIRYGGAFGDQTVCGQRPSEAACRDSCFRTFNPALEAWQCGERCAGGMAGIRFLGMQICLPCPNPPGDRIRTGD
jgi:hypothetical protein